MAGGAVDFLHCNQLVRDITAEEAYEMWASGAIDLILDVRSLSEYASNGDPAAHNVCGVRAFSHALAHLSPPLLLRDVHARVPPCMRHCTLATLR